MEPGTILLALVVKPDGASWEMISRMRIGDIVAAADSLKQMAFSQQLGPVEPPQEVPQKESDD